VLKAKQNVHLVALDLDDLHLKDERIPRACEHSECRHASRRLLFHYHISTSAENSSNDQRKSAPILGGLPRSP
jgi:hypothetical protein